MATSTDKYPGELPKSSGSTSSTKGMQGTAKENTDVIPTETKCSCTPLGTKEQHHKIAYCCCLLQTQEKVFQ